MQEQPRSVPPTTTQIRRWLAANGWTEQTPGPAGSFWSTPRGGAQVGVPLEQPGDVRLSHSLWGVVERIAGLFGRDTLDLASDMTRFTPDPLALLAAIDGVGDLRTVLLSVEAINKHINDGRTGDYRANGLAWLQSRVGHVVREAGEAWDALENLTGASARKGVCGTKDDLLNELGDTVVAGWAELVDLTGNGEDAWAVILRTVEKCLLRVEYPDGTEEGRTDG